MSISPSGSRPQPLQRLYSSLDTLRLRINGPLYLGECDGTVEFPEFGVYVFFSPDTDLETAPPSQWRISRIGTVGVAEGAANSLWARLRQHRGVVADSSKYTGGGNSRGSVFRTHVGRAILNRDDKHEDFPYWGTPHSQLPEEVDAPTVREQEHSLEVEVSQYIRDLPFLYVNVPGPSKPGNARAALEKNLIGMLSHYRRTAINPYDDGWLGHFADRKEIHQTGLWNIEHVGATIFDTKVVSRFQDFIEQTTPP